MAATRIAIILSFVVLALGAVFIFTMERPSNSGTALIGGPFTLTDHHGETVTDETYKDTALLVYFGFTFCPDICPTELQKLSAALDLLSEKDRAKITPLFISIDPERDTPEAMADYVDHFHPDMVGLTGTPDQIAAAAKAYKIYYEKVEDDSSTAGYTMNHTNLVYFMNRDHKFVTVFHAEDGPEKIAASVKKAL